jgi:hypothetical protein
MTQIFILLKNLGDDIADLVATELGLQNKRKVSLLISFFNDLKIMIGIFRSLIIIIYLSIHQFHDDQNVQPMI